MGQIVSIEKWAARNATVPRERYRAEWDISFVIWRRKWAIYDLIGCREGNRLIVEQLAELARKCDLYNHYYLIYKSKLEIYQGKFEQAHQTIEGLLSIGQSFSDMETAEIFSQLSDTNVHLSRFDQAIEYREKAAAIFLKLNDRLSYGRERAQIGLARWKKGDYHGALAELKQAQEIFEAFNDKALIAYTRVNMANVYLAIDKVEEAYQNYIVALEICRRIGDIARQSNILNNIGAIFYRKALYQKSLEYYLKGYELDRLLGNLPGQATKLGNMAIMVASLGRYQEALEKFSQALEIERQTGSLEGQMRKLGNMASLYGMMGEREKALAYIEEALDLARRIGSRGYLAFGLGLRSDLLSSLGRLDEAEANALEALSLAEACGNLSLIANVCVYLTEIYLCRELFDKALDFSTRAVMTIENNHLFEANQELIYFYHYRALSKVGRDKEALDYLDKAYRIVDRKLKDMPQEVDRQELVDKNHQYKKIIEEWRKIREGR